MSPRTFVTRGATLLVLATLGLAACKSETVIPPTPPDVQVTVSPSSATLTKAGQTVQFVALVTGVGANGNTAVTWKSGDATVATVAASGNTVTVTAVKTGTASIIATSVQDATRSGAALVTVNIPTDTTKPPAQPSVSIASITNNQGQAVDNGNVQGLINVALNVDVPAGNAISSVNWLIDGKTVCSQTFTQGKSAGSVTVQAADAVTMTCQVNTAQLTNGAPAFANGAHTLSATLVGPGGTISASTSQTLTFNNGNSVATTVATTKTAIGATGLVWNGGNLTVTVTPVIFTGGAVARVNFTATLFGAAGSESVVDSTAADGFSATFRGDTAGGLLTGKTVDSVQVAISTVTAAGSQGPGKTVTVFRFDNQAPAAVLFYLKRPAATNGGWINGTFKFMSAIDTTMTPDSAARAGAVDIGVDRVQYVFSAGPTRDSLSVVTQGSDLVDSNNATRYLAKVVETDALGNSTTVWATVLSVKNGGAVADTTSPNGRFGVDAQVPVVVFDNSNTVTDTMKFTTNPTTANYVIGFQDLGSSGFATANPVQVIEKADTGGAVLCLAGGHKAAACDSTVSYNSQVPVDSGGVQQGYITMTAFVMDRAGNKSNVLTRRVLVDYTAPKVDSASVTTSPLEGGKAETFRAFLHDTLSLAAAGANLQYTGVLPGPINLLKPFTTVNFGGFGTFTKAASADFTDSFFFRAVALAVGNTTPGIGGYVAPAAFNVSPVDVAGNAPTATAITGVLTGVSAPATDPFTGVALTATGDSSSAALSATLTLTGTAATVSPAAQVLFYQFATTGASAGVVSLVGTSTNPVITVNGTQATFTFTAAPTATLKPGTRSLVAVFVTSGGVALVEPATFTP